MAAAAFGADVDHAAEAAAAIAAIATGQADAIAAQAAGPADTRGKGRGGTDGDGAIACCGGDDGGAAPPDPAAAAIAAQIATGASAARAARAAGLDGCKAAVFDIAGDDPDRAWAEVAVGGKDRRPAAGAIATGRAIIAAIAEFGNGIAADPDRRHAGAAVDHDIAVAGKDMRAADAGGGDGRRGAAAQADAAATDAVAAIAAGRHHRITRDRDIAIDCFQPGKAAACAVAADTVFGSSTGAIGGDVDAAATGRGADGDVAQGRDDMGASAGAVAGDAADVGIGFATKAVGGDGRGSDDRQRSAGPGPAEGLDPRLAANGIATDAAGVGIAVTAEGSGIDQRIAADRKRRSGRRLEQCLAPLAIATGAIVMIAAQALRIKCDIRPEIEPCRRRAERIGPHRATGPDAAAAARPFARRVQHRCTGYRHAGIGRRCLHAYRPALAIAADPGIEIIGSTASADRGCIEGRPKIDHAVGAGEQAGRAASRVAGQVAAIGDLSARRIGRQIDRADQRQCTILRIDIDRPAQAVTRRIADRGGRI